VSEQKWGATRFLKHHKTEKKQREISPVQLLFKCSMFHTQGLLSSKRVEIAMNTISRKQKFTKLGTIQGRGDGPKASTS